MSDLKSPTPWTKYSAWAGSLSARLPKQAFEIAKASPPEGSDIERFVRLWIAEGIPFAFEARPILYELLREHLANVLMTTTKDISLTGSARLGFSVSPKKYLQDFKAGDSDLDLFAISSKYFEKMKNSAIKWCEDYKGGLVSPRSAEQKKYWDDNLQEIPKFIQRGMMNPLFVPDSPKYEPFRECQRLGRSIRENLDGADGIPKFKKTSIRIYKDWDSAYKQLHLNLKGIFTGIRNSSLNKDV